MMDERLGPIMFVQVIDRQEGLLHIEVPKLNMDYKRIGV